MLRKGAAAIAALLCAWPLISPEKASAQTTEDYPYKEICYVYAAVRGEDGNPVSTMGKQAQGAYDFFVQNYCGENGNGAVVPSYELRKLDAGRTKCVWIHIDRVEITEGWTNLPDEFSNTMFIDALNVYMREGGNIYLSGQATQLLSPMWRVASSEKANQWDQNNVGQNESGVWGISTLYRDAEDQLHPIFNGLDRLNGADNKFGLLEGTFNYENHNSIWNLSTIDYVCDNAGEDYEGQGLTNRKLFEIDNNATVLASFDWDDRDNNDYAGIIEFHPVFSWDYDLQSYSRPSGAVIANGVAAYQWRYFTNPDRTDENPNGNIWRNNIEQLTKNILSYLSEGNHIVKDGHPYNIPNNLTVEESLDSTGLIAMYVGYNDEDDLVASGNQQEYAAYTFFRDYYVKGSNFGGNEEYKAKYGGRGPQILWKGDKDKIVFCGQESTEANDEGFECVWVNIAGTRADIIFTDEKGDPRPEGYKYTSQDVLQVFGTEADYQYLIYQLKEFRASGGNIYTTKFANLILNDIDGTIMTPTQVTKETKTESDNWGININNYMGYDQSSHPIFSTMNIVSREHAQGITLFTGDGERLDTNCVWWLDNNHTRQEGWDGLTANERLERFNLENNATVLGVWGHDHDYAFYTGVLVEFHPSRGGYNTPERLTPSLNVYGRRGTIVANGVGAYEWDTDNNQKDDDKAVRQLTANTLAYLTPVMHDPIYTGIGEISDDENDMEAKTGYYTLQGMRVEHPQNGIYIEVRGNESRKVFIK